MEQIPHACLVQLVRKLLISRENLVDSYIETERSGFSPTEDTETMAAVLREAHIIRDVLTSLRSYRLDATRCPEGFESLYETLHLLCHPETWKLPAVEMDAMLWRSLLFDASRCGIV